MAGVKKSSPVSASRGVVYDLARARSGANAAVAPEPSDTFGITSAARELSSALRSVESADEARAERVRALRKQIADGTYNPDPHEIAVRLVERGF